MNKLLNILTIVIISLMFLFLFKRFYDVGERLDKFSHTRIEKIFEVKNRLEKICDYVEIKYLMEDFEIWYDIEHLNALQMDTIYSVKSEYSKYEIKYQVLYGKTKLWRKEK